MQIWDTTGSIKYVTETNLKSTDGVLLIYNITDRESFENLNSWLTEVKKNAEKGTCILLVGVNSDLEDERKVSYQEGKDFATSNGIKFFEVSTKNNINVKEAFEILSEDILNTKVNLKKYDDMNKPFHPVLPRKKDGFCNIY